MRASQADQALCASWKGLCGSPGVAEGRVGKGRKPEEEARVGSHLPHLSKDGALAAPTP